MRFTGTLEKDGRYWLAEIPILGVMTQGKTRKEAYAMVVDLVESLVNKKAFSATVHPAKAGRFEISGSDTALMIALLLRRQRETSGLSLAEVAECLGVKSKNAYARYERGTTVPTMAKLNELLNAVSLGRDFVLEQSKAA